MPRTAIHPGEHLAEELRELGITAAELSRQIDVPVNRVPGIIHGQRGITADTALRLGHWFGTAPQFWMNLQQLYELRLAENEVGAEILRCHVVQAVPCYASLEKQHEPSRQETPSSRRAIARRARVRIVARRPSGRRRVRAASRPRVFPPRRPARQDRRRSFPSPRRSCPSRRRCRQKFRPWW